jgi:hypothetical protein
MSVQALREAISSLYDNIKPDQLLCCVPEEGEQGVQGNSSHQLAEPTSAAHAIADVLWTAVVEMLLPDPSITA